MKSLLGNLLGFGSPGSYLDNIVLLLIGLLIISGGELGIQATPESEMRVVIGFSIVPECAGWMLIWVAFDGFLGGRFTAFLLSKTVVPFVKVILSNILGEERLNVLVERFKRKDTES